MRIINTARIDWTEQQSPNGTFARAGKKISEELGRNRRSPDALLRHPFDVEMTKVPPGKAACPYHSHSAQWEFYHVISGTGRVRHAGGSSAIEPGDAFVFKPNEPHQLFNDGSEDLVYLVVADNPIGESCYYPDSNKWAVKSPEYRLMRGDPLDDYDGEE